MNSLKISGYYDKDGAWKRTKQLGVGGAPTAATGVAVDVNSNVYLVGYTYGNLAGTGLTGTRDYFLTMYDSAGNLVRTKQLGVAGKSTAATDVAVDTSGNVYVAGFTYGDLSGNTLPGTQDLFVTTYDAIGNWVRTKQFGVTNSITSANSVAVDSSGNILVAGSTYGSLAGLTGVQDFFVTTYNSTGTLLRTKQLGASGTYTEANGVAIDANRNVYVTGYTKGGLDSNTLKGIQDFFITKFDSLGVKQ
ncbi:MAG: SBBP repeat-containing protein [Gallionellaceae bacterium]